MNVEELLKQEIENQYGTIYNFCKISGLSRSLFTRMSSTGIEKVKRQTLVKIAFALGIDCDELVKGKIVYKDVEISQEPTKSVDPIEEDIIRHVRELSVKGKFKVLEYIEDIKLKYPKE